MPTHAISIDGMHCGHCVKAVREALEAVPGITVRDVQIGSATVETAADSLPADTIKEAVEDAGYFAQVANGV